MFSERTGDQWEWYLSQRGGDSNHTPLSSAVAFPLPGRGSSSQGSLLVHVADVLGMHSVLPSSQAWVVAQNATLLFSEAFGSSTVLVVATLCFGSPLIQMLLCRPPRLPVLLSSVAPSCKLLHSCTPPQVSLIAHQPQVSPLHLMSSVSIQSCPPPGLK